MLLSFARLDIQTWKSNRATRALHTYPLVPLTPNRKRSRQDLFSLLSPFLLLCRGSELTEPV